LFDVVLLTGTNYVIRADVLRALGGWDRAALTEDLELSARLYTAGHRIVFVPEAVADDQDPDSFRVWMRQRTRWLLGNYYVVFHRTRAALRSGNPRAAAVVAELAWVYVTFLLALIASQVIFVGGLTGVVEAPGGSRLFLLWLLAFGVFVATIQVAATLDRTDSWRTPLLATAMYFVYCPLWLLVLARGLVLHVRQRGRVEWAKTPHFSR
jgi:cellulose synthase/poly-beta-1,6-N-acetylglucosamine synthase-like glycosyltransferase